jgi:uncharacterized repeat protein (TIGR03803 family)
MLTVLHSFRGSPKDGAYPIGSFAALRGELYGTTEGGGEKFWGTVFAISPSGKQRVLYSFGEKRDGLLPFAGVIPVQDTLYGTTFTGGANNKGTIYALSASGKERVLYSFKGVDEARGRLTSDGDGSQPNSRLVAVHNVLYGTTQDGGTSGPPCDGCGTVFSFDLISHVESVLHRFQGGRDGEVPVNVIATNGKLYGVTLVGGLNGCGADGCGTVYEISTSGRKRTLYRFKGGTDGAEPLSLVEANGSFYGITWEGGASKCSNGTMIVGCGTIFEIDTAGKKKTLYSFEGQPDGALPNDLIDVNGTLYGTTSAGGTKNRGTIFAVGASGNATVLVSFGHYPHGSAPISLFALNGAFYGMTAGGGFRHCYASSHELGACGEVFRFEHGPMQP